ncbi:Mpo1 family 2-hydroxy fatty acid dioxygenase [Nafulsella turpanensis]|uniref:Mpo1 family 2-hydroxy fatty acid dioxygenase n=1 Tax=Nafulsella turpanensis TaxID=1265690 RepID=UPI00034544C0|nr:Mpo1-like protein [Nafulsella turpanensis]
MRKIDALLTEYGSSHQNATNKAIHWLCVPLIFFSIVCLLWSIPSAFMSAPFEGAMADFANWATLLLLLTLVYYLLLSPPLFTGMLFFSLLCLLGAWWLDTSLSMPLWQVALLIFVLAWVGQFYGHKVEGKKPSFLKDLQFLLIGPAWLMHFIFKKLHLPY